ncbi:MAG TPA: wax ester/triacylglycerol synthase family O-acyltransferase, partial [Nevskiaceae bacterium]|nr:wax ester/triacylglycerol synthase family O-acyltransferase [Nevskiaceae bacterium]
MKRLSPMDALFLLLERRHQPLHVGALTLYEPPPGSPPDFAAQLAERLRQSTTAAPPFNRRLTSKLGINFWEEDEDFDLAHHFVHMSLPKPGRIRELLAMVSRVHCAHLDRAYPLWRTYLIEGLEDGRIATYSKIHHALVDGVAGIRLMIKSMSPDAEASVDMPPPWEVRTKKSRSPVLPVPTVPVDGLSALRGLAREGAMALPPIFRELKSTYADFRARNPDLVTSFQAPRCILNAPITASRRFAAQSYATARIKKVAAGYGATQNDVILAMCGAALRHYLQDLNALPDRPLVAGVPVSLRRDDSDSGNEVAFTLTHLGTHIADPGERLAAIKGVMDYNKKRMRELSPAQLITYGSLFLLPGAFTLIKPLSRASTALNVVISHVPGPRQPMYWQGCQLSGLYPVSLIIDGVALNITLVSRQDYVDFGLIACRKTL